MHCRLLAVNVPCVVLNVDYRLSPEWTFPTPFTDVFDAVDWILDSERSGEYNFDPKNVILGGVSAGGTLSLAAAVRDIEQVSLESLDISCTRPGENLKLCITKYLSI